MLRESADLSAGEYAVLDRYFTRVTDRAWAGAEVDLIVYIRSEPGILLERIGRRGRQGGAGGHEV